MKFTSEIHESEISFLDLKIWIDEHKHIQTCIYRKPTATNGFLHWDSWHPPSLKKGIPTGQYLRAWRNCSQDSDFQEECEGLFRRFRDRSYPKRPLRAAYHRARATPRNILLTDFAPKPQDMQVRCIGTFDNKANAVKKILRKHWHLLTADTDLTEVLTPYPNVTYRRGNNLRDLLVHSHLKVDSPSGSDWLKSSITVFFPCGGCSFCSMMPKRKLFINPVDNRTYDIRQFINCKSKGVVYGAICSCPKIYVGKTTQFPNTWAPFIYRQIPHLPDI